MERRFIVLANFDKREAGKGRGEWEGRRRIVDSKFWRLLPPCPFPFYCLPRFVVVLFRLVQASSTLLVSPLGSIVG